MDQESGVRSPDRLASILIAIPMGLWLIHIAIANIKAFDLVGCARFDFFVRFFAISTLIMIINSVLCLNLMSDHKRTDRTIACLGLLLNCSWIYYIKVIISGPTIGDV